MLPPILVYSGMSILWYDKRGRMGKFKCSSVPTTFSIVWVLCLTVTRHASARNRIQDTVEIVRYLRQPSPIPTCYFIEVKGLLCCKYPSTAVSGPSCHPGLSFVTSTSNKLYCVLPSAQYGCNHAKSPNPTLGTPIVPVVFGAWASSSSL